MSKLRRWMPGILCLLVIWLGVSIAVRLVSAGKPSAAAVLKLLEARPGAAEGTEARHAWIALVASRLAVLDLDSRHRTLMDSRFRLAFMEMSPDDQSLFLKSIETPGWSEFIEGSKAWNAGRIERLLPPALGDLEELETGSTARPKALLVDPAHWQPGNGGIESIFKDAVPLTRFDTRPLIERIQKYSQLGR